MIKLEEGERILYVARKHWFIFASETIFMLFLAFAPLALWFVPEKIVLDALLTLGITAGVAPLFMFFWSLWFLFLWMTFALLWTNYYLDVWLITNHRIIDIEQLGLFNRHIASFRYDQVQDATVAVSGLLATLIDFGTVKINTASNESFTFKGVSAPHFLKDKILAEHHRVHAQ